MDRLQLFLLPSVLIRGGYGQVVVVFAAFCPYSSRLRTGCFNIHCLLSLFEPAIDSLLLFLLPSVLIHPDYGQVALILIAFCPYSGRLWTGCCCFYCLLSLFAAVMDRLL